CELIETAGHLSLVGSGKFERGRAMHDGMGIDARNCRNIGARGGANSGSHGNLVMPALVAGINVFPARKLSKTCMAGTSPGMTKSKRPGRSPGALQSCYRR